MTANPLHPDAAPWARRLTASGLMTAIMGSSAPTPLYPIYRAQLGLDAFTMTLIFVIYVGAVLVALLVMGRLLARLANPYRLLAPALGLVAVAALVTSQAHGLGWLLAGRVLAGIATGSVTVAANVVLVELSPGRDARHAAMLSTLAFGTGSAAGPIVTGLALQWGLWADTLPFLLVAASAAVSMSVAARRWQALGPAAPAAGGDAPAVAAGPVRWWTFSLCAATVLVSWSLGSSLLALGPFLGNALLGVSDYALGGYVVAAYIVCGTASQWLHRRVPLRSAYLRGCALVPFGMAACAFALWRVEPLVAVAGLIVVAIGYGAAFGAAAALVNQLAPPAARSRLIAIFYFAGYVGNLMPLLLGSLTDRYGPLAAASGYLAVAGVAYAAIGMGVSRAVARR